MFLSETVMTWYYGTGMAQLSHLIQQYYSHNGRHKLTHLIFGKVIKSKKGFATSIQNSFKKNLKIHAYKYVNVLKW